MATKDDEELEAIESIKKLLRAGVELGVAEAVRRIAAFGPAPNEKARKVGAEALLGSAAVVELIQFIRNDPSSLFHLAKEVWSRGGPKDKSKAAEAIGKGLGYFVPHRALDAAKDLASMARSKKEAELVGREAIEPVLERSPQMLDRVKRFLENNERLLRQAAIAGLVGYVARKRKYAALAAELILLVAEEHEKEIRQAVRWGIKKMMEADPKATAKVVADWVKANPTTERVQVAAGYVAKKATAVGAVVGRRVAGTISKIAPKKDARPTTGPAGTNGASKRPAAKKPRTKKSA